MNIKPGDLVIATSGREKGKCFVVLSVENQFLYLCDGKNRKVSTPKKKKIKHTEYAGSTNSDVCEKLQNGITDKAIRKTLSQFKGNLTAESDIITGRF
ncbi:MAG: KOW domain-containing RNA-binding protein [Clostridia bacterium]|nr:KOW domain-containing RNA-binding protein [Clostridia bacterium]